MTKTGKIVVWVVAGLGGLLVVAALGAAWYVDSIAAAAIEDSASDALGVDTEVASVDIGLTSGTVAVSGLEVENPQGFESPFFLRLEQVRTDVKIGTLLEDTVHVPELRISGFEMRIDQLATGSNYGVILDNLEQGEKQAPAPKETPAQEPEKKLAIGKLTIDDSRVVVRAMLLPAAEATEIVIPLEEIVLEDLGTGERAGMSIGQLTGLILKVAASAVLENAGGKLPPEIVLGLKAALDPLQSLEELGVQAIGTVEGAARGALGTVLEEVLGGKGGGAAGESGGQSEAEKGQGEGEKKGPG